ncbi:hypothetical protein PTMSG1_03947 [Pyrenophora teres f. maculata]|nr:hypothetical protein PTMSG1_03947 [Pyrenophora teres f. maculata]
MNTSFVRRSTRSRTTKQSYVEMPEFNEDTSGDELPSFVKVRASKRSHPVVIDSEDDDSVEVTPPSRPSMRSRPVVIDSNDDSAEVAPLPRPLNRRRSVVPDSEDDLSEVAPPSRPSMRRRSVVPDTEDDSDEGANPPYTCHQPCVWEHASASAQKPVVSAAHRQSHHWEFATSDVPEGDMPTGDEDDSVSATTPTEFAVGIDVDEDSDEEDEFFPGPDPTIEDEVVDVSDRYVYNVNAVLEVSDVEVDQDFARKMRVILDTLHEWAKSISHAEFKAMAREDRPVTFSVRRALQKVSVEFLLAMYLPGIPLDVQELFSKKEWNLEDLLSLAEVEEEEGQDQGIWEFPYWFLVSRLKYWLRVLCWVGC